ncbi:MAG: TonB-dependent receptor [Bryobacterales bacterium]|nr:TonB-dependent receptor [Bryobacterales bacterium]
MQREARDITAFGAVAGSANSRAATQRAIDECSARGGMVRIPAGRFTSGTLRLKSGVALWLDHGAVLADSGDTAEYEARRPTDRPPHDGWECALILAERAGNVAILGHGTITGGSLTRPMAFDGDRLAPFRPRLVSFEYCRDVRVEGVTLRDPDRWTLHFYACDHVQARAVRIYAGYRSGNSDGIDVDCSRNVVIAGCEIVTGDDAIVLKTGHFLGDPHPCENITITNCTLSTHRTALKIGTDTYADFSNIAISNCAIFGSGESRPHGICLLPVDGARVRGVAISSISMRHVSAPIFLRVGARTAPSALSDVTIRNVVAVDAALASAIGGIPLRPVENVAVSDVRLVMTGGGDASLAEKEVPEREAAYPSGRMFGPLPAYGFYARHARGIDLRRISILCGKADGRPTLVADDVAGLAVEGFDAEGPVRLANVRRGVVRGTRPREGVGRADAGRAVGSRAPGGCRFMGKGAGGAAGSRAAGGLRRNGVAPGGISAPQQRRPRAVKTRAAERLPVMRRSILLLLPFAAALFGQEFRATIVGRVSDSSGAVIAGARVTATNVDTNTNTNATTTATGDYVIPGLQPGRYRLTVQTPGFKAYIQDGITLQVQDRPAIDVTLEPGEVTTTVTVAAETPLLETSTASRGEVVSQREVESMPMNGRNVFMLGTLTAGVTFTARGAGNSFIRTTSTDGMSSIAVSGGEPRNNEAVLDGISTQGANGTIQFVPSVEATQEFKVQTNNFDAELGRFTGGVVNATTKSGTNQVHGVLYEFLRNSVLNARDTFAGSKPQFGYNLFGGSLGGPVYLPKLYDGRNRTFFFFNYEGSREGVPRSANYSVPTLAQRKGDFSTTFVRLSNGQPQALTIYDPDTTRLVGNINMRDPFPGNVIPGNRINPVAANTMKFYPDPNVPGDPITAANNWRMAYKDPVLDNGVVARIDHRISDRHQIFGRYTWRYSFVGSNSANPMNVLLGTSNNRPSHGIAVDDTYTLNPTTVLNIRAGFSRLSQFNPSNSYGFDAKTLGFAPQFVNALEVPAFPTFTISGYQTLGRSPLSKNAHDSYSVRGGINKITGSHSLRAGAEARVLRSNILSPASNAAGTFAFNNAFTRGPNASAASTTTGSSLASLMLGLAASGSVSKTAGDSGQVPYYGIYIQDDWRIASSLTVNLGLRYEWEGANTERYDRYNRGFFFDVDSPIAAAVKAAYALNPIPEISPDQFQVRGGLGFAGVNGAPRAVTDIDRNNLAPRVGISWKPFSKTVIRGGYGIFYGATTQLSELKQGFSQSTPFVASVNEGLTPENRLTNPFPDGILEPRGAALGLMTYVGQGASFVNLNRQNPAAQQFQFGIQRELPAGVLVEAAYAGNITHALPVNVSLNHVPKQYQDTARELFLQTKRNYLSDTFPNPFRGLVETGLTGSTVSRTQLLRPYPQFTSLTNVNDSIGSSRYDSLQIKFTKRMSKGLMFRASYTNSKTLERRRYLNAQDRDEGLDLTQELVTYDIPQRVVVSGLWELPFGPGKPIFNSPQSFTGKLIEGWQLNVVYTAQGGIPLVISGAESVGRSAEIGSSERNIWNWFDRSAFRIRDTLEYVATSRLPDLRSHGRNNVDLSLFKNVVLAEQLKLQVRIESFNAFNRPEYNVPDMTFGGPAFGTISTTNIFARQFQFGLRLVW